MPPNPPPRLFLIRHGETAWSLTGQHTGRTDLPLTANGEAEARALAPALERIPFVEVWTSPLQRAHHTAELAGLGAVATVEAGLAEWDYGTYDGVRSPEIQAQHPGWSVFRDGAPGGESAGEVGARADRLVARLRTLGGNVALFTHGHFGAALAVRWLDLPLTAAAHFPLATASVSTLTYHPNHPGVPVVARWNATVAGGLGLA